MASLVQSGKYGVIKKYDTTTNGFYFIQFISERLLGADYMIYGICQDWVHQNPGDHLDGGIAEESNWKLRWEKLVCMTTQRYDAPSGKVGKRFVVILSVELDGIRARKWNAERVIIFQSVILQHTRTRR